jgi:hypothetical protein
VPAEALALHVHDGVFTRMGASDNMLQGRSTFMEELGDASEVGPGGQRVALLLGRRSAAHWRARCAPAAAAPQLAARPCAGRPAPAALAAASRVL